MCYTDHSVWTVCAHVNHTQHTCKRGPILSRFSACLGWTGWSACKPSQKWVYRIRLGFCPECVEVFEPQFNTKDIRAILNYWTWKASTDSTDTRYSHGFTKGILKANPFDVPVFQIWGVPARPEPTEEEGLLEHELLARSLDLFWIPDHHNRLTAAIQARRATKDYFSSLAKGFIHTARRGCYPPRELVPRPGKQPDAESAMPLGVLAREGPDDDGAVVRSPPVDLTVPRTSVPRTRRTRHFLVESPHPEREQRRLGYRQGNPQFPPPQLRREDAFSVDDQDGEEFEDIELEDFQLTGRRLSWGSDIFEPRADEEQSDEEQSDEEHSVQVQVHDDDNASSAEPPMEVAMSLITSLVDDPYVEAQDAVAIWVTSVGPGRLLTGSPSRANTRIPEPRAISQSGNGEAALAMDTNQEVDPASVELPEMDVEEVYFFMDIPWPPSFQSSDLA